MAKATSYASYCPVSQRAPLEFQGGERWRAVPIDTAECTTIRATGSNYGLVTLDVGEVVTRGFFVVTTAFGSTSNDGTIKFLVNDATSTGDLTGAIVANGSTSLILGHVVQLGYQDYEDTVSIFGYNASVALQVEWAVATHSLTAGAGILYLATVNVYNLLNNG